jgi:hypothetical protein
MALKTGHVKCGEQARTFSEVTDILFGFDFRIYPRKAGQGKRLV